MYTGCQLVFFAAYLRASSMSLEPLLLPFGELGAGELSIGSVLGGRILSRSGAAAVGFGACVDDLQTYDLRARTEYQQVCKRKCFSEQNFKSKRQT